MVNEETETNRDKIKTGQDIVNQVPFWLLGTILGFGYSHSIVSPDDLILTQSGAVQNSTLGTDHGHYNEITRDSHISCIF